ncbi:hypothetical protein BDA96_10G103200 [Sorghum bicolor]|uniref:Uncharacterized protein n=1 Tax=Sorghum bicolor TaxID=4558 RepID=A0A921Q0U8_SORBI|nr:hypothetical protein BDA96_10G103200 [Sorghum bicolor]
MESMNCGRGYSQQCLLKIAASLFLQKKNVASQCAIRSTSIAIALPFYFPNAISVCL